MLTPTCRLVNLKFRKKPTDESSKTSQKSTPGNTGESHLLSSHCLSCHVSSELLAMMGMDGITGLHNSSAFVCAVTILKVNTEECVN